MVPCQWEIRRRECIAWEQEVEKQRRDCVGEDRAPISLEHNCGGLYNCFSGHACNGNESNRMRLIMFWTSSTGRLDQNPRNKSKGGERGGGYCQSYDNKCLPPVYALPVADLKDRPCFFPAPCENIPAGVLHFLSCYPCFKSFTSARMSVH